MKNMSNKEALKNSAIKAIVSDKYDLPLLVCKNLKNELKLVLKRYLRLSDDSAKLTIKTLKSGEFLIELRAISSGFLIK